MTQPRDPTAEEWAHVRASCPELASCGDAALHDALQPLKKIRVDPRTVRPYAWWRGQQESH